MIEIDFAQMAHIRLDILRGRPVEGLDEVVVNRSCKADRSTIRNQLTEDFHTFHIAVWSWYQWLQYV